MNMISLTLSVNLLAAKKGTIIEIFTDKIIGISNMDYAGTVIVAQGGATIPVVESKEQILKLLSEAANNVTTTKGT